MTAPNLRRTKRGTCPGCGRPYQLTRTGKLARHVEPADPRASVQLSSTCAGSGHPPVTT